MALYKKTYRIESARLKGYDYSQPGEYFITICTGGITKTHNPMLSCDSLSYIIRQYKSRVSFEIHKRQSYFTWQPRFHDRIIRDEKELNNIRDYIVNNPIKCLYNEKNWNKIGNPLSDQRCSI